MARDGVAGAAATPSAFHLMSKPRGAICNLDCEYCFFLTKEELYPGSDFRMSRAVLEAYITQLVAGHADGEEVVLAFQGGEPTMMGVDFFRTAVALARAAIRPTQQLLFTIQTNGTLLDDGWGEFLAEEAFLVGLSIDGPREMHDVFRVDKGGKPTFDRVLRGLDVLRRHDVEWNALTTVNAANAGHGREVYTFLRDELGARFVQLIPIVEREGDGVSRRTIDGAAYGRFLVDVFEEWVRHDVGDVFVTAFDTALAHWLGMDQVGSCVQARTCGTALALEHNGDLYACDHFVDADHLLGNIRGGRTMLELVTSPQQVAFGRDKERLLPGQCRTCRVRFACNGGCPKDRFATTTDGEAHLNYLCAGYLHFFTHVDRPMRLMADLARRGEDAAGVRSWYARADARRASEEPCTCGAGRTWTTCHGSPAEPPGARSGAPPRASRQGGDR
jgi:uncharacterized protein